jgi:hypothetical protein
MHGQQNIKKLSFIFSIYIFPKTDINIIQPNWSSFYHTLTEWIYLCLIFDLGMEISGHTRDTLIYLFYTVLAFLSLIQSDTKKRELLKNPTKIEEIQEKIFIDRN